MSFIVRRVIVPVLALALVSCANSAQLAKQSTEALERGDVRKAYDRARSAIDKDPANQDARRAYGNASRELAADTRQRVLSVATADTLAAADLALYLRELRVEAARRDLPLAADLSYESAERAILTGAARVHYQRGIDAMAAHRPKRAVDAFTQVRRFDEQFMDVAERLGAAVREATARVAILPFTDGINVPGLSQEIGDSVRYELSRRAARDFRYTQLIAGDDIDRNMTVAMSRSMNRDDALSLGKRIGADWVIVGRFYGLRANNSQRDLKLPLYHRVDVKDSTGKTVVRWDESLLQVVTREREVTVQYDFDVLDVATGTVLAHGGQPEKVYARVAWSDYRSGDDFDRYALLPNDVRQKDAARARSVDAQWRDYMGSWNVPDVLRQSRDQRTRSRYSSRYRNEFYGNTRERPVWMGELPTENDMAFVALRDVWRPVLAALKQLDAKD